MLYVRGNPILLYRILHIHICIYICLLITRSTLDRDDMVIFGPLRGSGRLIRVALFMQPVIFNTREYSGRIDIVATICCYYIMMHFNAYI